MRNLVSPAKSLCLVITTAVVLSGSASFASEPSCENQIGELTNVQFVVAAVPDSAVAKARANEIALGVLMTWFDAGN